MVQHNLIAVDLAKNVFQVCGMSARQKVVFNKQLRRTELATKSGGITKRGNQYLRKQLVHGARALLSRCKKKSDPLSRWVNQLVARRGVNKACVALASRLARIAWVLLHNDENYKVLP